jgi:TATA-binding protein-associated factor Taf7
MKCPICGNYYNEKKYTKCVQCFPCIKEKQKSQDTKEITDTLNQGQLSMVYGEMIDNG